MKQNWSRRDFLRVISAASFGSVLLPAGSFLSRCRRRNPNIIYISTPYTKQ